MEQVLRVARGRHGLLRLHLVISLLGLVDGLYLLHLGLSLKLRQRVVMDQEDLSDHVALLGDVVLDVLVLADLFVVLEFVDVVVLL